MTDPREATGGVWPMGVPIGQSWFELGALAWLCGQYEIESFVELGILEGGLSSVLLGRTMFAKDFRYLGIENEMRLLDLRVKAAGDWFKRFEIWEVDAFENETIESITFWIRKSSNPALIYCDNGDKPRELETYSKILRHGDLIAAHDFNREYKFKDLKVPKNFTRIESDWLTDTHIIAFAKGGVLTNE
ncbi:hypothetical protein LCGC14_1572590 [marine sediment metagenome]|uniref:Class I SAM-dependent methyltransferase n=1 Tax=marine sediment metagenome TaxID=412755 RepID=A0A0F9IJ67_9ZZZZ